MEHYCLNCDGHFKSAKFDQEYGRCKKCSKPQRKQDRKQQAVFDKHADINVGDLVQWSGHMCVVACVIPDRGWELFIPKFGSKHTVFAWDTTKIKKFVSKASTLPKE